MWRLRWVVFALLLAGMAFIGFRFPSRPNARWPDPWDFGLGSEACRELLEGREQTTFTWPETAHQPVLFAEVARRFDLELALICRANSRPAACGGSILAPGEQIVLPLGPEPPGTVPAAPPSAATQTELGASPPPGDEGMR